MNPEDMLCEKKPVTKATYCMIQLDEIFQINKYIKSRLGWSGVRGRRD